jgi:hypothetical protein
MTKVNENAVSIVTEDEVQTEVLDTIEEPQIDEPQVELTEKEQLTQTRTGKFKLPMSHADAVYFRNILDKAEFTGSNLAYLLIIAKVDISQVVFSLKDEDKLSRHDVELNAASIESINYFLEKKVGVGEKAAHKVFAASMILRQPLMAIKKLDEQIAILEEIEKSATSSK